MERPPKQPLEKKNAARQVRLGLTMRNDRVHIFLRCIPVSQKMTNLANMLKIRGYVRQIYRVNNSLLRHKLIKK
jgi:hypothetical protein